MRFDWMATAGERCSRSHRCFTNTIRQHWRRSMIGRRRAHGPLSFDSRRQSRCVPPAGDVGRTFFTNTGCGGRTQPNRATHSSHRLRRFAGPGTIAAKTLLAVSLARLLQTLAAQLDCYRERINVAFAQHPDHGLFGSLPGAGEKLAPRLLAEIGEDRSRLPTSESLQTYGGTAPVTIQSGKDCYQRVRRACKLSMRSTVHLWEDLSRRKCAWAETYYQAYRKKGNTPAIALRCLGQRWLKILWIMWQTGNSYDEALHTRNQREHGSWVLSLNTSSSRPKAT